MKAFWMFLAGAGLLTTFSSATMEVQEDEYEYDLTVYENSEEVLFDETPEFITTSSTLFVDLGGSIHLPCQIKYEKHFTTIWKRNNVDISLGNSVLSEKSKYEVKGHGRELLLKNVTEEDTGWYECHVAVPDQNARIQHLVRARVPPRITQVYWTDDKDGHVKTVAEGDSLEMTCSVFGFPDPSVSWRTETEAGHGVRMEEAVLSISPVTRRHRGNYTCRTWNGWSNNKTVSRTVFLDVQYPPVVTLREAVDLSCDVEANPPARLLWSVDGVTRSGEEAGSVIRAGAAVRCLAENSLGVDTAENTEMRLRGLEQRLGDLEEKVEAGGQMPGDLASCCPQMGHSERVTDQQQLGQRISHLEEKLSESLASMSTMKARAELINMLKRRIEDIHEFQRTHIEGHKGQFETTLSNVADIFRQDIHRINAKISELDGKVTQLDEKVDGMITDMREEADIPVIEINRFLDHSRVTSSLQSPSSASSCSRVDIQGLFISILVFLLFSAWPWIDNCGKP